LGEELLDNPSYDTDIDGWDDKSEPGGSISWSSLGYIELTTGATSSSEGRAEQQITTVPQSKYILKINRAGAGSSMVNVGTSSLNQQLATTDISSVLSVEFLFFTATTASSFIGIRNFNNFNSTSLIDNISVRELTQPGA
jgi:hypothetical protein